jgi:hypothetical protein
MRNITASVHPGFACRKRSVGPLALLLSSCTKCGSIQFAYVGFPSSKSSPPLQIPSVSKSLRGAEFTATLSVPVPSQTGPCQVSKVDLGPITRAHLHPSGNRSISRALFLLFRSFAEATNLSRLPLFLPHTIECRPFNPHLGTQLTDLYNFRA